MDKKTYELHVGKNTRIYSNRKSAQCAARKFSKNSNDVWINEKTICGIRRQNYAWGKQYSFGYGPLIVD